MTSVPIPQLCSANSGDIYDRMLPAVPEVTWSRWIWPKIHCPKASFIGWMAMQGRLYTMDRVLKFAENVDPLCCLCKKGNETHDHLFFRCDFSQRVLKSMLELVAYPSCAGSLHEWNVWFGLASKPHSELFQLRATAVTITLYCIWQSRNEVRFQSLGVDVQRCFYRARSLMKHTWCSVQVKSARYLRRIGKQLNLRW